MGSIYRGFSFPFDRSDTEFPAAAEDDELIKQSVIQCILTAKGERIMRPDFGSGAYGFVFDNNSDILADQVKIEVRNVVAKFEPRALVTQVFVERKDTNLVVTVGFVVVATRNQHVVEAQIPVAQ